MSEHKENWIRSMFQDMVETNAIFIYVFAFRPGELTFSPNRISIHFYLEFHDEIIKQIPKKQRLTVAQKWSIHSRIRKKVTHINECCTESIRMYSLMKKTSTKKND